MRRAALITITVLGLGLAACGDDDDSAAGTARTATATAAAVEDVDRYCALGRELDADGEQFFSGLGEDASPAEYEAAERRFVEASAAKLDELQRVAPREIKADVATVLAGQRQRAGLESTAAADEAQASAAEKRVRAYEKRSCSA